MKSLLCIIGCAYISNTTALQINPKFIASKSNTQHVNMPLPNKDIRNRSGSQKKYILITIALLTLITIGIYAFHYTHKHKNITASKPKRTLTHKTTGSHTNMTHKRIKHSTKYPKRKHKAHVFHANTQNSILFQTIQKQLEKITRKYNKMSIGKDVRALLLLKEALSSSLPALTTYESQMPDQDKIRYNNARLQLKEQMEQLKALAMKEKSFKSALLFVQMQMQTPAAQTLNSLILQHADKVSTLTEVDNSSSAITDDDEQEYTNTDTTTEEHTNTLDSSETTDSI